MGKKKLEMTKKEEYEERTKELLLPVLEELGFELEDVEFVKDGGNRYLRATIDKPGGITIDDCETVSRRFSHILDREDYIAQSYIFEVSSPGLLKPLSKDKDFQKNIGKEVEIKTYQAMNGKKEFIGVLKGFDKDTLTIEPAGKPLITFQRNKTALVRLSLNF